MIKATDTNRIKIKQNENGMKKIRTNLISIKNLVSKVYIKPKKKIE